MKQLTQIILSIAVLSFIYAHMLIEHTSLFDIYTFHIPMVLLDFVAIALIWPQRINQIAVILIVLIGLSVVNHSVGAYGWVIGRHGLTDAYDFMRPIIFAMELLALVGGWCDRIYSARPYNVARLGNPGILIMDSDKVDNLCP